MGCFALLAHEIPAAPPREHQWRPKKPYVDWVQFQPLITSPSGADQQDEAVRAILSHLGNVYRLRETQETWQHQRSYDYPGSGSYSDLDRGGPPRFMREIANPIIQDFWAFHSLPTWGVLIPVPIDVRMLYWAGSIYKTGEVTPLKDFLDIQYVKWHDRDAHYAADIDKELWTAMRTIDIEKHK
ncbi:hypothetical protein LY76DRAFT_608600 [Colletotrichum caudatum]|nr:hypothetical protein LY76DRAFT_608600 [Colletotrichum caudatum]